MNSQGHQRIGRRALAALAATALTAALAPAVAPAT